MRISANKSDPGYRYDIDLSRVRIFIDGQQADGIVTADEGQGIVMRHKRNADGSYVIEGEGDSRSLVLETAKANVRIEVLGDDGLSIRAPKVKVERQPDGQVAVLAYSRLHPRNIRRHLLERHLVEGFTDEQFRQACGIAAGAAAEHLCENHGDIFDPSEAARAGIEAAALLLANEGALTRH